MHKADLHIHTTASDGVYSPSKVVLRAKEKGVDLLAITDHDCISGIEEAKQCAKSMSIHVLSGVEIGTGDNSETHVLGYGVNTHDAALSAYLQKMRDDRRERAAKICGKLSELGMPICLPAASLDGSKALGRPQIARAMLEKGYVSSVQEAFERYLGRDCPAYVPRGRIETVDAIHFLRDIGAVPVLAHPCQIRMADDALMYQFSEWLDAGLAGVEIYHPSMNQADRIRWMSIAQKHRLLITGGSDFHAPGDKHADIGDMIPLWENCSEDAEWLLKAVHAAK